MMPGGDGTGPMGDGPMTGWGTGFCGGDEVPEMTRGVGRGLGFGRPGRFNRGGRGGGRGRGRGFGPGGRRGKWGGMGLWANDFATPEERLQFLKARAAGMEGELTAMKQRIASMDSEASGGAGA